MEIAAKVADELRKEEITVRVMHFVSWKLQLKLLMNSEKKGKPLGSCLLSHGSIEITSTFGGGNSLEADERPSISTNSDPMHQRRARYIFKHEESSNRNRRKEGKRRSRQSSVPLKG